nr:NIPSNAP family protein [uncultured Dyadobacter sp.]
MQRRKFLQSSLVAASGTAVSTSNTLSSTAPAASREIYEWREYEFRFGADQSQLENYFRTALIPALNKLGVKSVGVFREWRASDPARFFALIPYASLEQRMTVQETLKTDQDYIKNSAAYNGIPVENALYSRFTSSLMIAFQGWPAITVPAAAPRVFELRTYEGYSEEAVARKIGMFHDGEFPIFKRAGLNPVFFGDVIAGDKLPRLTYLLTCESMEARDKGWAAFIADPAWKKLVGDPKYANTISKITNSFLIPTDYSQV